LEERESPRLLTQRHLEGIGAPPSPPTPGPAAGPTSPPSIPPNVPAERSNAGLLERQLRWFRERSRFDARPREDEGPK